MVAAGGLTNPLRGSARVSGTRRVAAGASTAGLGLFGAGLRPRRGIDRQLSSGSTWVSVPASCSTVSRRTSGPEKTGRLGWLLSGELAGSGARPLVGNASTDHPRRGVPVPHKEKGNGTVIFDGSTELAEVRIRVDLDHRAVVSPSVV